MDLPVALVSDNVPIKLAVRDVLEGCSAWHLWGALGWNDIRQRYRRSLLGPFWLTASMAIMVVSLGLIYSHIFKTDINNFIPFLTVGLLIWGFMSSTLGEAGTLFVGSESYIKQVRLPLTIYVNRFVWSRLIIFAHNSIIYLGVMAYFGLWPKAIILAAVPGLIALVFNAAVVCLFVGMISARFRDIPQIISSFLQIAFFITPIMWKPEYLGEKSSLIVFNPLFHMIEIIRAPLLGYAPSLLNCGAVFVITVLNATIAAFFFVRYRPRVAYWV